MKAANIGSAFFMIALSIVVIITSSAFPEASNEPGAAFFPRLVSGLAIVLAVILVFQNLKVKTSTPIQWNHFSKVIGAALLLVLYLFGFLYIGYVVSTVIILFLMIRLLGSKKYVKNGLVSITFTVIVFLVFGLFLEVPLPEGLLW